MYVGMKCPHKASVEQSINNTLKLLCRESSSY